MSVQDNKRKPPIVAKYYTSFNEYLSFFVNKNNAFIVEEDDKICAAVLVYETPDMFCGRSLYIEFLAVLGNRY